MHFIFAELIISRTKLTRRRHNNAIKQIHFYTKTIIQNAMKSNAIISLSQQQNMQIMRENIVKHMPLYHHYKMFTQT